MRVDVMKKDKKSGTLICRVCGLIVKPRKIFKEGRYRGQHEYQYGYGVVSRCPNKCALPNKRGAV